MDKNQFWLIESFDWAFDVFDYVKGVPVQVFATTLYDIVPSGNVPGKSMLGTRLR